MLQRIKRFLKTISVSEKSILSGLNHEECELIHRIRSQMITYLSVKKLARIAHTCRQIETNALPGIFIEAGCALGGSSILIASMKKNKRPFFVYDVFGMIPPPTKEDTRDVHSRYKIIEEGKSKGLGGEKYYGYEKNLYEIVNNNLKMFGINRDEQSVSLIKGLVQDTLKINQPVAFAHIDVDWYEPVITCLKRIFPSLVIGGSIILDDYYDWGGCKKATDEYLNDISGKFVLDDSAGSLKITKIKN
ncbi:MAG: TylF/MycF/NovP-related O-methyltransferase [Gammaproteobacteria bacterium]|nr:TylF/MycF/NovP-related O-methyltransferase [Gammaproteobacteria bacterium]